MEKDIETIKNEIETFKSQNGGNYQDYYIGITNDVERRLVETDETIIEHKRNGEYTQGDPTYKAECYNRDEAVEIEQYFQIKGMQKFNPRSVGVDESKFIYCYKMTEENKGMVLNENSEEGKKMNISIKKYKDFINGK